jgi:hypothetical protein
MSLEKKINYNKRQASKYGWTPQDFGGDQFDADLIQKIQAFQEEEELDVDGMAGPATYRRLVTRQEADANIEAGDKCLIMNGKKFSIDWDKVVLWTESKSFRAKKGTYSSYAGKPARDIKFFVTHWDVCLSSASCQRVLDRRGLSVQFLIDNDGTIYQTCDMRDAAWHAGRRHNSHCVGVEISDAYSLKYQRHYSKRYGPRPIWRDKGVHGKTLKPFLGFYQVQIDALAALWECVSRACEIPLEIPPGPDAVYKPAVDHEWRGFLSHFHLTRGKIDCAGLNLSDVLSAAKKIREEG